MALEGSTSRFDARDRQRVDALAVANAKRSRKARLKKLIRSKDLDVVEMLSGIHPEWDEALGIMKLEELLRCIPRVGGLTVQEVSDELHASMHIRVRSLEPQQREELAGILRVLRGDNLG